MAPTFTQRYVLKQALEEGKQAADAKRLVNIEKVKHSVIVYGWVMVSLIYCASRSAFFNTFLTGQSGCDDLQGTEWIQMAAFHVEH
jgi:hypothetical protein